MTTDDPACPRRLRPHRSRPDAVPASRTSSCCRLRRTAPVSWVEQDEAARGRLPRHHAATGRSAATPTSLRCPRTRPTSRTSANGVIIRFGPRHDARGGRAVSFSCSSTTTRPSTPSCARSCPAASRPKAINALHDSLRERSAHDRHRGARRRVSGDFVDDVAAELPLQAICDLLGFPQEDRAPALRVVERDDVLRRPRDGRRADDGLRRDPRLRDDAGRRAAQRAARRHHHAADLAPTSTAAASPTTSSGSS